MSRGIGVPPGMTAGVRACSRQKKPLVGGSSPSPGRKVASSDFHDARGCRCTRTTPMHGEGSGSSSQQRCPGASASKRLPSFDTERWGRYGRERVRHIVPCVFDFTCTCVTTGDDCAISMTDSHISQVCNLVEALRHLRCSSCRSVPVLSPAWKEGEYPGETLDNMVCGICDVPLRAMRYMRVEHGKFRSQAWRLGCFGVDWEETWNSNPKLATAIKAFICSRTQSMISVPVTASPSRIGSTTHSHHSPLLDKMWGGRRPP